MFQAHVGHTAIYCFKEEIHKQTSVVQVYQKVEVNASKT